ncbi:BREX-2 system adenine-specific DNA-methyltransferase PglX [Nodosilinea sp. E11]|uniref:BREX-2 system adenine-specific DNA-methyltransferase PglX n=1 Tax=Nodosilinea sp. E11 TaxID=3037479 RepID=UPI00293413BF|nr:BREX-2 system adenine-specific DNA-methyltransferase PglX [Nodosilinea sp. E11]WOD37284.1 BREX-2 system adenine-specific DNA-methyltransferase PglX [Nodosilinea sp. E11]
MINRPRLLADLQSLVRKLEADLQERIDSTEVPEVGQRLRGEYDQAKRADRTAQTFNQWAEDYKTQVAVAWVLSATFARFLEDNGLVSPPRLSGLGDDLQRARDEYELYFSLHPTETDREYLLGVFGELAKLPGAKEVFGEGNLLWQHPTWLSGDGAKAILAFFQTIDPGTGSMVHDFADPGWDTRFLGDLYQDLSEAARKKYALLQTPIFVEQFVLDRTLDPAIDEFGLDAVRMIDPACGSGHFLLGSFERLLDRWLRKEPGTNVEELARRALEAVHGVDVNPYAVAIARFRLLLAAMKATNQKELRNARAFPLHVACGDSLLHGEGSQLVLGDWAPMAHHFASEDIAALNQILRAGHYHAVVANPPYIVPRDSALNGEYRRRYRACHRQYSLAVPFMERIFQLAVPGSYTGQITANSFMKREFGKKLIEVFFPQVDLTHVIDTSGAYIPGHGTPTVILFGRNRAPVAKTIRTVMGIRGEPSTPEDPTQGLVWTAILDQVDVKDSESEFVSVADSQRDLFHQHPWSIGGGGASELKEWLDQSKTKALSEVIQEVGFGAVTREDDVFLVGQDSALRKEVAPQYIRPLVAGEEIRDWAIPETTGALWPYEKSSLTVKESQTLSRFLWLWKRQLSSRVAYGLSQLERGLAWFEYSMFFTKRFQTPLSIAFAFVATHNHFVLDRGGKVFNRSAPVIKLPATATEDDHLALLGLLNSSTACFWMKQVFFPKGGDQVGSEGARIRKTLWDERYEFAGTGLQDFPVVSQKPLDKAKKLDQLAAQLTQHSPASILQGKIKDLEQTLETSRKTWEKTLSQMIALQEELDWECYSLYKLVDKPLTYEQAVLPLDLGQRAFEIILARKIAAGKLQIAWFERHRSTPITELPAHWPDDYKQLIERRIHLIETDKNIGLIEQPEYKRRWNTEPWESQLERALQNWLLNRLESYFDLDGRMNDAGTPTAKLPEPALISTAKLADFARQDPDFIQVGELYTHNPAFDVLTLVNTLVESESVPLLPVLRYKATGQRKRQDWQQTWALQRQEDAIDARTQHPKDHPDYLDTTAANRLKAQQIGDIPVPPKYTSTDFLKPHYWKLRGKLDVPKERWVSFPHCAGPDGQPVIAWAGYNHLQLALALSAYFVYIKEDVGGHEDPRLIPLLAGLIELLPWLHQWHNDLDPAYGLKMGDYIESFIQDEARQLNLTPDDLTAWQPPKTPTRRRK